MNFVDCEVSYRAEGITYDIRVKASSLYEAVALAYAHFLRDRHCIRKPDLTTEFTVIVQKPVEHRITLKKVYDWCAPSTKGGPAGKLRRDRLRLLLAPVGR